MYYSVPNLFSPRETSVDSCDLESLQQSCCCINLDFFYLYGTLILQRKCKADCTSILSTVQVFNSMIYSQMFLDNEARPMFDFSKMVHVLLLHKPGSTGIGLLVIRNYRDVKGGIWFRGRLFDFSEDSSFEKGVSSSNLWA
jgi:hypothetical protein